MATAYATDPDSVDPEAFMTRRLATMVRNAEKEGKLDQLLAKLPRILGIEIPPEMIDALRDIAMGGRNDKKNGFELTRIGGHPAVLVNPEVSQEEATILVEKEMGTAVALEKVQARTDGRALYRIKARGA